jgi:hypothetical protein
MFGEDHSGEDQKIVSVQASCHIVTGVALESKCATDWPAGRQAKRAKIKKNGL